MVFTILLVSNEPNGLCRIDGKVNNSDSDTPTAVITHGGLTGKQGYVKLQELHAQYAPLGSMSIYLESSLEKLFDALQQKAAATGTSNRPIENTSHFKKSPPFYHGGGKKVNTHNKGRK